MDIDSIAKILRQEWTTITGAPVLFIVSVLVTAYLIWQLLSWHYSGRFHSKQAEIEAQRAQIDELKSRIETREQAISQTASANSVAVSTFEHPRAPALPPIGYGVSSQPPKLNAKIPQREERMSSAIFKSTVPLDELRALHRPDLNFAEQQELLRKYKENLFVVVGLVNYIGIVGSAVTIIISEDGKAEMGRSNVAFAGTNLVSQHPDVRVGSTVKARVKLNKVDALSVILDFVALVEFKT